MSTNDLGPTDLTKGWCLEGIPLEAALARIPAEIWAQRAGAFSDVDDFEARAALFVHVFTGLMPRLEDTDGRQGAVDLTLHSDDQLAGIVEVTSTLDAQFQRDSDHLQPLVQDVSGLYRGVARWALGFEHGWCLPRAGQRAALAGTLARALESQATEGDTRSPVQIAPAIVAHRISAPGPQKLELMGWNANVPDARGLPYLDRLAAYLSSSTLVARKLKKLASEAERLGTSGCHLYLLMASTGNEGGLLPVSPAYLTWGDFSCPAPVTDLWLDGGTGEVYHWTAPEGWRFHRV